MSQAAPSAAARALRTLVAVLTATTLAGRGGCRRIQTRVAWWKTPRALPARRPGCRSG
jgi:hypothetical protein